jgi:hypothetical protein
VLGLRQSDAGFVAGRRVISIEIEASLVTDDPGDEIRVEGVPPITVRMHEADGLRSAAALMVNCIPAVVALPRPGIVSLHELPVAPHSGAAVHSSVPSTAARQA